MSACDRQAEHQQIGDVEMIHVASALTALVTNEDGATMVEYAIMLACIAILCIGTVRLIGEKAFNLFGEADTGW